MTRSATCSILFLSVFGLAITLEACSVTHISTGEELVANAEVVVRARAVEYKTPPARSAFMTTGTPDSVVSFVVIESIEGSAPSRLTLHGYLTQRDDFNDRNSPYTFVRPGGRAGSCFANSYRQGAEYLLFLKPSQTPGELTVNWAALAPVNEQLHGGDDPWLIWTRAQALRLRK